LFQPHRLIRCCTYTSNILYLYSPRESVQTPDCRCEKQSKRAAECFTQGASQTPASQHMPRNLLDITLPPSYETAPLPGHEAYTMTDCRMLSVCSVEPCVWDGRAPHFPLIRPLMRPPTKTLAWQHLTTLFLQLCDKVFLLFRNGLLLRPGRSFL
jgi:hypothetical protein